MSLDDFALMDLNRGVLNREVWYEKGYQVAEIIKAEAQRIQKIANEELNRKREILADMKRNLAVLKFSSHFLALYQSLRNAVSILPAEWDLVGLACIKWSEQLQIGHPRSWYQEQMENYGRPYEMQIEELQKSQEIKSVKSCKRNRKFKVEVEKLLISEFPNSVAASTPFIKNVLRHRSVKLDFVSICKELMASMAKMFPPQTHKTPNGASEPYVPSNAIYTLDLSQYPGVGRRMRKFLLFRIHQLILLIEDCGVDSRDCQIAEIGKLFEQLAELTRPVTDFGKIFQQFDTNSMLQIFADLNTSVSLQVGQVQVQSRLLPTALVKIVNTYCDLDPLSTADDKLITRNLLK